MFGRFQLWRSSPGKTREELLRRSAAEAGYRLIRSSAVNRHAEGFATYALIDPVRHTLEFADPSTGYGLSLDEVEEFLATIAATRERRSVRGGAGIHARRMRPDMRDGGREDGSCSD